LTLSLPLQCPISRDQTRFPGGFQGVSWSSLTEIIFRGARLPHRPRPGSAEQAAPDTAIAGTAQNPIGIAPLALTISDPPTQGEVQAIMDAYNALLAAIQR